MVNLKKLSDKQVKLLVITLTIFLILAAVFTNNKSIELNLGMSVIIWLFESSYIIPYIEKEDMSTGVTTLEYNEDNILPRLALMVFAVFVCVLNLYLLFKQ